MLILELSNKAKFNRITSQLEYIILASLLHMQELYNN